MKNLFFTLFMSGSTLAATTHYVDTNASGSNNGTSWVNAWTAISSATGAGVSAGDTVYIHGAAGTPQNYTSFTPKNGTAGNPITYQIGQDSGHNGTAKFSGSGSGDWLNNPHDVNVVGDAGDGAMHFIVTNYSKIVSIDVSTGKNLRLGYINFGTFHNNGDFGRLVNCEDHGGGIEFDHNFIKCDSTTNGDDIVFLCESSNPALAYDTGLKFHHNYLYAPQTTAGLGMDGLRIHGIGNSIYNNYIIGYASSGSQEHADGLQDWQGGSQYLKIYNNVVMDFNNASLNVSAFTGGGITHCLIYNNLSVFTSSTAVVQNEGIFIGLSANGNTMTDCVLANNLTCNGGGLAMNNSGPYTVTWVNCYAANNISVQSQAIDVDTANGAKDIDNVNNLSAATAANFFTTYVNSLNGTNNNFHLLAGATNIIARGTNLTALGITTDMDGNARPSSGNWDIGPFQFASGASASFSSSLIGSSTLRGNTVLR